MREKESNKLLLVMAVVNILFVTFFAILFNFFPERVGYYPAVPDWDNFVPVLAPDFERHLPWLNLWWGLSFTASALYLGLRQRTTGLRWLEIGVDAVGLIVVLQMVILGDVLRQTANDTLLRAGLSAVALGLFVSLVRKFFGLVRWWVLPRPRATGQP